jgi:paraquat-inducible protein A
VLALSLAALILYPAAMALPVMRLERFGHGTQTTIWGGAAALIRDGHAAIGLLVLVCSIVIPLAKLLALIGLSWPGLTDRLPNFSFRHRHVVYRMVEWLGRWGMVDVLLVAVLIAAVKLGDVLTVRAGPGVTAFGGVVILSLLASACFDPGYIWRDAPARDPTSRNRQTKPVER